MQYDWPGNVRELENVIERAAILARARARCASTCRPRGAPRPAHRRQSDRLLTDDERRERDRANILAALESCGGKVFGRGGAAELLDVKPTTLASRIKALGITVEKPRRRTAGRDGDSTALANRRGDRASKAACSLVACGSGRPPPLPQTASLNPGSHRRGRH